MSDHDRRPSVIRTWQALTRLRLATVVALLLVGAVTGFAARCGVSALFVNAGSLAALRGEVELASAAFEAATAVDPNSQAAGNFRLSQALVSGDYERAADELATLRARGGTPRGVANRSSVRLHLEAIQARRKGDARHALALAREAVVRAGVNAPEAALRLLDELSRDVAEGPYGPSLATVELSVDPRRDTCGGGHRLARVRLSRNDIAAGGPVRADLEWSRADDRYAGRDTRLLRNLAPNGAFTWGVTGDDLPLGYAADPTPFSGSSPAPGETAVGFADLDGHPVFALVMDNLDAPERTTRLRSDWIPAAAGACYLFASEVWVGGGQPYFGLYLHAAHRPDSAVFGIQGGLADGWRREARLVRLPADIQAVRVFFWNYRSSGATAFTLALVARIDA